MNDRPAEFDASQLLQILGSLPAADKYVVAFSGGADSTALLHALHTIESQLQKPVLAAHVNHGLHDDATRWESNCKRFCSEHGIPLECLRVRLTNETGKGLEAEARERRYEALSALLNSGDCLLTGHHADDQAETVLLNLMRGSGVDGLSAMPESRPFGKGLLQRPLLRFEGDALRRYLRAHGIEWMEDPSNQYLDHDRNFVRHEVIPLLEKRWPNTGSRLLRTARAMADAREMLEAAADDCLEMNMENPLVLTLSSDLRNDPALFRLAVRRWVAVAGLPGIPSQRLAEFQEQVMRADNGQSAAVSWNGSDIRLYDGQLWLCVGGDVTPCPAATWQTGSVRVALGGDTGELGLSGQGATAAPCDIVIASRAQAPSGAIDRGTHHVKLKHVFQEARIPPWLRDCVPICMVEGELAAVGDWYHSARLAGWLSDHSARLEWRPGHPLLRHVRERQQVQVVDPTSPVG